MYFIILLVTLILCLLTIFFQLTDTNVFKYIELKNFESDEDKDFIKQIYPDL